MEGQNHELEQLRRLIGVGVIYRGTPCCIIEVLEDGPALVLRDAVASARQTDQYGKPLREVPVTYTVPVIGADGQWNGELLGLPVRAGC